MMTWLAASGRPYNKVQRRGLEGGDDVAAEGGGIGARRVRVVHPGIGPGRQRAGFGKSPR